MATHFYPLGTQNNMLNLVCIWDSGNHRLPEESCEA